VSPAALNVDSGQKEFKLTDLVASG
jgi:hypothetical protein